MREARTTALEEGVAIAFPFKASDVEALHSSFQKSGHGIYFRLKDGRVFSAFEIGTGPNPALYDTAPPIFPVWPAHANIPPARTA